MLRDCEVVIATHNSSSHFGPLLGECSHLVFQRAEQNDASVCVVPVPLKLFDALFLSRHKPPPLGQRVFKLLQLVSVQRAHFISMPPRIISEVMMKPFGSWPVALSQCELAAKNFSQA